jgi:alpha/beta superfamily hydrolase
LHFFWVRGGFFVGKGIETFELTVDGIRIVGEVRLPDSARELLPVVVICHGIPSGRPAPGDGGYRPLAKRLADLGFLTVLFNFRGCGLSGGSIDLAGWCCDLSAVIDMLLQRKDVDEKRLNLVGFSGGAAVSCVVAARDHRVSAVGLMACPAEFSFLFKREELSLIIRRAREIGAIRDVGFPTDPKAWLEGLYGVKAEATVEQIAPRPLLIVHGTADEVVPVEQGQLLYRLAGEPKELVLLEGVQHRLRQVPQALEAAVEWLCRMNLEEV